MKTLKLTMVLALVVAFGLSAVTAYAQHKEGDKDNKKAVEPTKPVKPAEPVKEAKEKEAVPLCPVSGERANLAVSTMTDNGPVYFCCKGCIEKYKADTKKFAGKVAEQHKILAKMPRMQVTCPVSGKPINKAFFANGNGGKVYFCDKECVEKYNKEAAKFKGKLEGCCTYQTKCPIENKEIDPAVCHAMKNGDKIHFCCKDCQAKFEKDVDKYLPALAKQGYTYKAADFKAGEAKKEEPKKNDAKKNDVKKNGEKKEEPKKGEHKNGETKKD